jgi:2-C-methyl-D-erythritol 2,4-cyclodiphosphate synthase|tara:strand:+ start:2414 stop:2881 length:468 start_codon:yes stop_codon:yes gene_type:complete
MRIGQGYDVHAFEKGDHIVIGGVRIPFKYGLMAHSDGDVLIHSLCDALLGAAALGDIGRHFPDTDPRYFGINSRELLRVAVTLVHDKGYCVSNADITVVAEAPKIAPHINEMVNNLASDLGCDVDQINVKATTTESLGFEGRGEGIACHAIVLLA